MNHGTARLLAAGLAAAAAVLTGCSGGGTDFRTVPALSVALERAPGPEDRELVLRIGYSALSEGQDPVASVEVEQSPERVGVRVLVRERVPDSDEPVPNNAATTTRIVHLEQPFGRAAVVDLTREPPAEIAVLGG